MANAQWTQLGPGQGGQHRANYLYQHGTLYDVYIGSDVSGVWVAKDIDEDNIAKYENYHYQYISNNKIMRFVNRFYNNSTFSSNQLFVTHRNGIERIDMTNPTAPMTSSFINNDGWVSDMYIVGSQFNNKNQIYFVTGSVRLNDEPGNHKNTSSTNDFYYGQINASFNITSTGVNLPDLGLASPEKHVYCLWVGEGPTNNFTDDQFLVGTEYGLYSFNYTNITNANIPTHVTGPTGIATDAYKVTGITNISPNQFLINVAYQGLYLYNSTTQTWTTQITELMSESELNSNITYTDMKNNPNAKAFTQLLRFPATGTQKAWILMSAENLITYQNQNYFVGAYYCPVISANNNLPDGHWKGFNTLVGNNNWGWNTSKPAANIYGSLVTPNNYLLDGKSGNAMITSEPIDDITPLNTLWNQTYCKPNIANNNTCSDKYEHIGLVNTAPKCIYKDNTGKIWLSQNDRLLWLSSDDGHEFQEKLTAPVKCSLGTLLPNPNQCNHDAPLSDCFFTINDPYNPTNLYAGVGSGFATNKGDGYILKFDGTNWNSVGQGFCGDPIKMIFRDNVTPTLYCIINIPNQGSILHYLNGTIWTPCTIGSGPNSNMRDLTDAVISPDGEDLFVIHNPHRTFFHYSRSTASTFVSPICAYLGANTDPLGKNLCLIPFTGGYKILMGTQPTDNNPVQNLYEVFTSGMPCSIVTQHNIPAIDCNSNAEIFKELYVDNLDQIDGGINYIAVNTDLHIIYVAAVANNYNATTPVKSVLYKTDYDAATGAILNCWTDITGTLPNKAIQFISTNGSNQCTGEYLYAAVRGLGAWKCNLDVVSITGVTNNTCAGLANGTATVNAPASFVNPTYLWSTGATTPIVTGLVAGTYTVTVTNTGISTCTTSTAPILTATVIITAPSIKFDVTNVLCNGGSTGSATANLINGGTPTLYDWGTVLQTTATVTGLAAATYPVSITDNNNCITTASVVITQPQVLTLSAVKYAYACSPSIGGKINCDVTGGTKPYQFKLTGQVSFPYQGYNWFKNLPAGNYTVTVTDANGCSLTASKTLAQAVNYSSGNIVNDVVLLPNGANLTGIDIKNSTVYIGANQIITVPTGNLNIINSTLTTCPGSQNWQGIASTTTGTITVQESTIENANIALDINNGKFLFQYSKFDNNDRSLYAHGASMSLTTSKINECSFYFTKLPTFDHLFKDRFHLYLENCTGTGNFGSEDGTNPNYFSHAGTGIYALNTNINIFNSKFEDIGYGEFEQPGVYVTYGNAIYALNRTGNVYTADVHEFKPTNSHLQPGCSFKNVTNPIIIYGQFNTTIEQNKFDFSSFPVYVRTSQNAANTININQNDFRNYINAVGTYDCFSTTVNINNNLFNMFDANTTIPYSPLVYGGRAITVREVKGNLKLNILGNKMNNTREGIYCINVKAANNGDVNIGATGATADDFSNRIYMQMPAALINAASPHYGINMLNCEMAKVASNYVEWNTVPTLALQSLTRGISIMDSKSMFLVQNKTFQLGTGIRYWGDCTMGQLKCNTMESCYQSVYLDPVGVNNKISDVGMWNGNANTSTSWKNRWINNINPVRVEGSAILPINWTYNAGNTEYELGQGQYNTFFVTPHSCADEDNCEAPNIAPDDDALRMALYGDAVGDSSYYFTIEPEFLYNDKAMFYSSAYKDSGILYQSNNQDAAFITEYDSLSNTNIGKMEDAKQAFENNDYTQMQAKLGAMVNENNIEQNHKSAMSYYQNFETTNDTPSFATVEMGEQIAYQHPFLGGEGVYLYRAMLDIEHEDQMPQLRKYFAHAKNSTLTNSIIVLPNPAKNNLILSLDFANYTNPSYTIINTLGQSLWSDKIETNETKINITSVSAGVYYLKVMDAGLMVKDIKIIVIK